jgi:hypothetical protein
MKGVGSGRIAQFLGTRTLVTLYEYAINCATNPFSCAALVSATPLPSRSRCHHPSTQSRQGRVALLKPHKECLLLGISVHVHELGILPNRQHPKGKKLWLTAMVDSI